VRRILALNILVLVVCVLAVEALGQIYYRMTYGASLADLSRQFQQDAEASARVFERHPYLVAWPRRNASIGREGATITTTSMHTRVTGPADPKAGAIRVAAVGGSTTFGTKVTDADSWPWLLQEALGDGYAVINYGVPGYTTAENIIQMALLVPEARPAIVIFYEGWNDIRNYHWPDFTADYYGHGMTQTDTLLPALPDRSGFVARAARYSFVMRLLGRALGTPVAAASAPPSGEPDAEVDRVYARNLHTLRALANRFGMTPLFVPQVLNTENYVLKGQSRTWTPYIEDAAMPALMRRFNGLMADECGAGDGSCTFVAEALAETWNGNDFVDEGHLSRQGGEKLAALLAARVRRLP